ncbi:Aste57867_8136 [Aphanomyces stellatus]|uniref:Aste57867_8136 protein n=1 Tax=Aphanomyces stellatus TaxID=120398 RepID=A0A485KJG6_9STRA|nr:hypothetical protein As57867_008106 [Aphanomyces stellatus]VFT85025.1 Aste57867_8136 [Aphanomyces stellatus]
MLFSSHVLVEETHWLFGRFFTPQCWSLQDDAVLTTFASDENAAPHHYHVRAGCAWPMTQYGIQVEMDNGAVLHASAASKIQWAMWLDAFQKMAPPKPHAPVKVTFSDDVGVVEIPQLTDEEKKTLFAPDPDPRLLMPRAMCT